MDEKIFLEIQIGISLAKMSPLAEISPLLGCCSWLFNQTARSYPEPHLIEDEKQIEIFFYAVMLFKKRLFAILSVTKGSYLFLFISWSQRFMLGRNFIVSKKCRSNFYLFSTFPLLKIKSIKVLKILIKGCTKHTMGHVLVVVK